MAADQVVWGVRVTEELKQRITSIIEQSGLKAQDYLENLINQYQLNNVKDNPLLQADISELQMLTNRINNLYINVSERIQTYLEDKEIKQQEVLESKNRDLGTAFAKIDELKANCQELGKVKAELEVNVKEYVTRIKDQEEQAETSKALIAEYKEKNDTLTGLLKEYKEYKTANAQLTQELEAERRKNRDAETAIKEKEHQIEVLKSQIQGEQVKHKQELNNAIQRAEFDKDRSLLEINVKHNEYIQELTEQHNKKVQELTEQNNMKVQELLAKLEARTEEKHEQAKNKKAQEQPKEK